VKRREVLTFVAVLLASAILAVLATLSLRQWEVSAERRVHEQARDMAAMAAEKIEMAVLKLEEEGLGSLRLIALDPHFTPELVEAWKAQTSFFDRVYLCDRQGKVPYPRQRSSSEAAMLTGLRTELSAGFWDRGGRRHIQLGDQVALVAVIQGSSRGPLLAVLRHSEQGLRRDILEKTLTGLEGQSLLAVLDKSGRPVYAARSLDRAQHVLSVDFGEALPAWRLALYEPEGLSPRDAVRRQAMLLTAVFVLLLGVIAVGLGATFRLVRRESEMARLKSDFVANVSHDLKTPLALIRMFAETLEMDRVPSETSRREYYGVITRESERLTRLIDNVLDFSRIEDGRQRYEIAPEHVEPIVSEVLEAFRYPLAQQGFKVDVHVEPDLPEIRLDPEAIKQALANLVDNAIKYSGERRRLSVTVQRCGGEICLAVSDEGIGIPAQEQERIFEKFYRVGRSETQGRRGSGVGLALVKHIVTAHGGKVTVESQPGEGSTFTLRLPLPGAC
jgi:signal transduction histidine kinase